MTKTWNLTVTEAAGIAQPTVALVTEGNYPFTRGGVSTWCDQLVRGLPDLDFTLISVLPRRGNATLWDLPSNVSSVIQLAFWEPDAPGEMPRFVRSMGRAVPDSRTSAAVAWLLEILVHRDLPDEDFGPLLEVLIAESRAQRLAPALRSQFAVEYLAELWRITGRTSPISEVVLALDYLEHFLRTVSVPMPKADVFHAVSNGLAGLVAMAAAQEHRAKLILSEHGVYLRERYLEYMWGRVGSPAQDLLLRCYRLLSSEVYRRADQIVPVSRYNARWALRNGVNPSRLTVVHNGVDPSQFPPRRHEVAAARPSVGLVARVDRIKDPLTLVRAAAIVRQRVPDVHVRIWGGVADGQDDYDAEVQAEVARLDLLDAVTFEGHTSDVAGAIASVDVAVLCSISEGLPYSVLESMMAETAIVSTDVGGIGEALEGVGVLVPPRSPEALAAALTDLLTDPVRRKDLGKRAGERARQHFSLDRMMADYTKIYRSAGASVDRHWTSRSDAELPTLTTVLERWS